MGRLFRNLSTGNDDILWFLILFLLLFWNNSNSCGRCCGDVGSNNIGNCCG